jgi:plasmid stability protein
VLAARSQTANVPGSSGLAHVEHGVVRRKRTISGAAAIESTIGSGAGIRHRPLGSPAASPRGLSLKRLCLQSASIEGVRTLYVRNVPNRVYEALERRAQRNGRSLNAEALAILQGEAEREQDARQIAQRLAEIAAEINLPADAPKAEDLIREDRDSR